MFSYKINEVSFNDPIIGIDDLAIQLDRVKGVNVEALFYRKTETNLSFSGEAYNFIVLGLANLCSSFDLVIYDSEGAVLLEATFYSYMITIDHASRIATTQLKESTWAQTLYNRTDREIFTGSTFAYGCNDVAIDKPLTVSRHFYDEDDTDKGERTGIRPSELFRYLVESLTDGAMSFVNHYANLDNYLIFTGQSLKGSDGENDIYPVMKFSELYETIRKIFGVYLNVVGDELHLYHESDTFVNISLLEFDSIPKSMTSEIDKERNFDTISVGGKVEDVSGTYPQISFTLGDFRSCNCETDKENKLDLTFDWYVDSNTVMQAISSNYERDKIFLVEDGKYYNTNGKVYYNETLTNDSIVKRWNVYVNECLLATGGENILDINQKTGIMGLQARSYTEPVKFLMNVESNRVVLDLLNGLNYVNVSQTYIVPFSISEGYFYYRVFSDMPISFTLNLHYGQFLGVPINLTGVATFSIVAYTDDTLSVELERASLSESFVTDTTTLFRREVKTPLWQLPKNSVVVVEAIFDMPEAVSFGAGITRFSTNDDLMNCYNIVQNPKGLPYKHTFETSLCKEDFERINANRFGYFEIHGVKSYLQNLEWNAFKNIATLEVVSENPIFERCEVSELKAYGLADADDFFLADNDGKILGYYV